MEKVLQYYIAHPIYFIYCTSKYFNIESALQIREKKKKTERNKRASRQTDTMKCAFFFFFFFFFFWNQHVLQYWKYTAHPKERKKENMLT